MQKITISAPSHHFVGLCLCNWSMYRQSEKKLVKQQHLSTCPHNIVNFGLLSAEIGSWVWGTRANFSRFCILPSLLQRHRSPEANQTSHDVWLSPSLVHYIYNLRGSCLLTEFCLVQNSVYVQLLRSRILATLLHGTPAAGVSQALRLGARNGITELSQRAPPIFSWAAITLGIGSHSSFCCLTMQYNTFQL